MEQKAITVITELRQDSLDDLKKYLQAIGDNIKTNPIIQFSDFTELHYCSFFIIEDETPPLNTSAIAPLLVFEANIDGSKADFIANFMRKHADFLHYIYSFCTGYPGANQDDALAALMLNNDFGANAFYIAHPGQTRTTIAYQNKLRDHIETYVDANKPMLDKLTSDAIRQKIIQYLTTIEPGYSENKPAPKPLLSRIGNFLFNGILAVLALTGIAILLTAVGIIGNHNLQIIAILIIGLIALYLVWLRCLETHDKQDDKPWEAKNKEEIQAIEDRQLQNHLTSVIDIKPGGLRLTTLRIVLFAINLAATLVATKGNLSGIVTIHFARWVILPAKANERRRLLFMSNYDGSWENYLGEFIDHASVGLTAVWSNTQLGPDRGFPDTQWLALKGGSRDEQRFKAFARNSQRRELIWYSAYPGLSVKNIANNRAIHEGLFEANVNISDWLKQL
jgi:hypothetical protein